MIDLYQGSRNVLVTVKSMASAILRINSGSKSGPIRVVIDFLSR
jgi:hypothetical protein